VARYFFTIFDGASVCYAWDETASDDVRAKQLAHEIAIDLLDDGGPHHALTIAVSDGDGNEVARLEVGARQAQPTASDQPGA